MQRRSILVLAALGVCGLTGCATQRAAVRNVAAQQLACPEDAIKISRDEGRLYRATGCGLSVRIACHDPHESTGAAWGWADPLTAGKRAECEPIIDRPVVTTSATTQPPTQPKASSATGFDRERAAQLLALAAERAKSCGGADGARGNGAARVTFASDGAVLGVELAPPFESTETGSCVRSEFSRVSVPAFGGSAVTVRKQFEVVESTPR
jgi:hypothetical protein